MKIRRFLINSMNTWRVALTLNREVLDCVSVNFRVTHCHLFCLLCVRSPLQLCCAKLTKDLLLMVMHFSPAVYVRLKIIC